MSYYRNYRKPYYYHHYRHYRRGDNTQSIKFFGGLIIIGIILALLNIISSSILLAKYKDIIGNIIFWALLIWLVIYLFKKIRKVTTGINNNASGSPLVNILPTLTKSNIKDIAEINSKKHGCKCYMDGLTDGEQEIAHILAEGLSYKDYFIFNNLTIPSDFNGSSQIDHLVVSKYGIFVIESKDYKGWIFGTKDQEHWTQSLAGGNNKYSFQNPIHQNWSHIRSLEKLMPFIKISDFQNVVVFTDSCEIKTQPIENVLYSKDIIDYIKKFTEVKINNNDLQLVIGKLSYTCQTVDISPDQHIENLNQHHN